MYFCSSRCEYAVVFKDLNAAWCLCRLLHAYVRPILEYNTPVWNPWLIHDIKCVERVQRFFTRAIYKRVNLPPMSYSDRLTNLGLRSLEYRRLYFDLVMCFKIVKKTRRSECICLF